MRFALRILVFLCALTSFATICSAEVKLHALFADHMVLQQGVKAPVWGTADPGEQVRITLGSVTAQATADAEGRWKVELGPLEAGGPLEMTASGKNTLTLHDVAVGEVWICSGQSNMEMAVGNSPRAWGGVYNSEQEIAAGNYPMIRQFTVKKAVAGKPQSDVAGEWLVASPQTVGEFTAAGYFFGREIHKALGVPVGLIHTSWGGTPAESWTSQQTLLSDPELAGIVESREKELVEYPQALDKYRDQLSEWRKASRQAEDEGKIVPQPPKFPNDPRSNPWRRVSGLYNAMLAPLIPYAMRGAIWYQGEANADRAYQYRKLFPAMIQDWRRAWGEGDFPFLFVQLANFNQDYAPKTSWAELREAQTMTLSLPKTGMAVTADIGDPNDIHPKNKQEVGRRLALAAEAIAYGKDVVYSGPVYESMKVEGNRIRLSFTHVDGGLRGKSNPLKSFEIAGADRKFEAAQAKIEGKTVVVHSAKVAQPVAVRYAWADNPECSLYNKAGLPAVPFRSDDWPGVTEGKK
jgi:sialate O-acetylesterase